MHKRCEDHVPHSCGLDHKKMSDALALIAKSGAKLPEKQAKTAVSDISTSIACRCYIVYQTLGRSRHIRTQVSSDSSRDRTREMISSVDKVMLTRTHTPPQYFDLQPIPPLRPPPRPSMSPPLLKVFLKLCVKSRAFLSIGLAIGRTQSQAPYKTYQTCASSNHPRSQQ